MPTSTYNNRLKKTKHAASASMSWIEIAVLVLIGALYILPTVHSNMPLFYSFPLVFLYSLYVIAKDRTLTSYFVGILGIMLFVTILYLFLTESSSISKDVENSMLKRFASKFTQMFFMFSLTPMAIRVIKNATKKQKMVLLISFLAMILMVIVETTTLLISNPELSRKWAEAKDVIENDNVNFANYSFVYIVPLIIVAMGAAISRTKNDWVKLIYIIFIIYLLNFLLQTQFTISLIIAAFAIVAILWMGNKNSLSRLLIVFTSVITIIYLPDILRLIAREVDSKTISMRINDLYQFLYSSEETTERSLDGRYYIYMESIKAFFGSPLVGNRHLTFNPHSTILGTFADLGLMGGVPYMILYIRSRKMINNVLQDKTFFDLVFYTLLLEALLNPIHASMPVAFGAWLFAPIFISVFQKPSVRITPKEKRLSV